VPCSGFDRIEYQTCSERISVIELPGWSRLPLTHRNDRLVSYREIDIALFTQVKIDEQYLWADVVK
jgi:hypothetical protein